MSFIAHNLRISQYTLQFFQVLLGTVVFIFILFHFFWFRTEIPRYAKSYIEENIEYSRYDSYNNNLDIPASNYSIKSYYEVDGLVCIDSDKNEFPKYSVELQTYWLWVIPVETITVSCQDYIMLYS